MTKEQFRQLLESRLVFLDGATGSNLMAAGMPVGCCPEAWIIEHPKVLLELQKEYIRSGSNILLAPTFTGNRIKLSEYGLEKDIVRINSELVALSKQAVKESGARGYVAGDMTMTGKQLEPIGTLSLEELIDVYKEQARILADAGCDLFFVETMMSLAEARAAVIAVKEVCDLPVMVSMTFQEDGKTLFGSTPESCVVTLQALGADAVGINCSTGPAEMVPLVKRMIKYAKVPVFAKPNNGMPELIDGKSTYTMKPEEFAGYGRAIVDAGVSAIGGCCGSTPKHIAALKKLVRNEKCEVELSGVPSRVLSSETAICEITPGGCFKVVGERINPTGKKKLQEELKEGKLELVARMAEQQTEAGAHILDINMGMNGIDEKEMMRQAIFCVMGQTNLPLCIDSSHVDIIEMALRLYPGRALINSISLEEHKLRPLLKIAKKYGAMCICLPLSDEGLPKSVEERKELIRRFLTVAKEEGLPEESIVVDALIATVGAQPDAALNALSTIEYCKNELKLPTICGLSNISFGLPERINVNTAFLTMAIEKGLTMAIANPGQAMLMNAALASDLLLAKEGADDRYVENVVAIATTGEAAKTKDVSPVPAGTAVYEDVVKGNKAQIVEHVKQALADGKKPQDIIDGDLIPAVNKVGELFETKKYFLPQLIAGATAMDLAIEYITPLLGTKNSGKPKGTIVIATVEGDIHDIGKNLVVLMLKNYGYTVYDLGKDVPAEDILAAAKEKKADVIGLSALMTTTMMRMKDVCDLVRKEKLPFKVMIGGAVVSESFAKEIGADGDSRDANEAVKLVEKLLT